MNSRSAASLLLAVVGTISASSCAWVPTYISDPGVTIERVSTRNGRVTSANFWMDERGFELRGEIAARPTNKGPLGGHVDIEITAPDGASAECMTTHQRNRPRHVRKPFSLRFLKLPARGSVLQVKHHNSADHNACAG